MRIIMMFVVSLFFVTLFPLPAFATQIGGTVVDQKPTVPTGIAVLVVKRTGVSEAEANDIANRVATAMKASGIEIKFGPEDGAKKLKEYDITDPALCKGNLDCVAGLGSKLNVATVVAVQSAGIMSDVVAHIKVVSTASKLPILTHDLNSMVRGNLKSGPIAELDEFVKKAKEALQPSGVATAKDPVGDIPIASLVPNKTTSDAPKVEPKKDPPALVIKPPREFQAPPPDVVTKAPPSHAMRYIGIGSGIVGVAVIGVGAYFGVDVMNDKAKAQKTTSLEEFNSLKEDARGKIQTADILYGVGGGLLATGVVLFVVDSAMNNSATPTKSVSIAVLPSGGISVAGTW